MPASQRPITDIACIIRAGEEHESAACDQAIALAQAASAHLAVTVAAQQTSVPYSPIGGSYAAAMVADINKQTQTKADALADAIREKARLAGINADVRVVMEHVENVAEDAVVGARAADLIVIEQPEGVLDTKGLILEAALFRSGRPVLLASRGKPVAAGFKRLMVAWDGSQHAARALADALALFPSISRVEIVYVAGETRKKKALPGADLAHHLARKGVETMLTELHLDQASVAETLNEHARRTQADMIAMGGYGHSRFREFLFGGVTVELTQNATIPLLMAY